MAAEQLSIAFEALQCVSDRTLMRLDSDVEVISSHLGLEIEVVQRLLDDLERQGKVRERVDSGAPLGSYELTPEGWAFLGLASQAT